MIEYVIVVSIFIAATVYAYVVGERSKKKVEALRKLYAEELVVQTGIAHSLRSQFEGREVVKLTSEAWGDGAEKEAIASLLAAVTTYIEIDHGGDRLRAAIRVATLKTQ